MAVVDALPDRIVALTEEVGVNDNTPLAAGYSTNLLG
jgi:hypothetical protein